MGLLLSLRSYLQKNVSELFKDGISRLLTLSLNYDFYSAGIAFDILCGKNVKFNL